MLKGLWYRFWELFGFYRGGIVPQEEREPLKFVVYRDSGNGWERIGEIRRDED